MSQKIKMGVGQQVDTTDFHVEAIDLLSNHVPCEAGVALVVAIYSALKRLPVQAGFVILGDMSIQGNIKPMRSLARPLSAVIALAFWHARPAAGGSASLCDRRRRFMVQQPAFHRAKRRNSSP